MTHRNMKPWILTGSGIVCLLAAGVLWWDMAKDGSGQWQTPLLFTAVGVFFTGLGSKRK
jgi:hypothetical protein